MLGIVRLAVTLFGRPGLPHMLCKPDNWPLLGLLRFYTKRTDMVLDATAAYESLGSRSGKFSFFFGTLERSASVGLPKLGSNSMSTET